MDSLNSGQLWIVSLLASPKWADIAYHLLGHHDNGLNREASVAVVEEVLQRWSEEVDN